MPYRDKEYEKKWVKENPEKVKANKKKYVEENGDKVKANALAWYYRNIEQEQAKGRAKYRDGNRIIDWLIEKYEGQPCMDCERAFPYCAMEFDHRGDEPKEFHVSKMNCYVASSKNIAKVMKEIDKCDFVCACCHKIRTWERLQ